MTAPDWAIELVDTVCKDYHRSKPTILKWRNSKFESTSGTTWSPGGKPMYSYRRLKNGDIKKFRNKGEIRIRAGKSIEDQRLVLLHELAHHIAGKSKKRGHDKKFWDLAFELYRTYGVELEYAFKREKDYKVGAVLAYNRIERAK